jgi:hypothetical protein
MKVPPVATAGKKGALFAGNFLCAALPGSGPRTLVAAFTAASAAQVRQTPSWPRSWANFSLL